MLKNKSNIYNLSLILISIIASIIVYKNLPDLMPMHWNIKGQVDSYGPKELMAFLSPIMMLGVWLGMLFLPRIDPRKDNYIKFEKSYTVIISTLITFFFVIHIVTLLISSGYNVPMHVVVPFMIGLLFMIIGYYLPKSKSNFFYGIKTPWTLSSDKVWDKTHKLGGKIFFVSGFLIAINSLLLKGSIQFINFIILIVIPTIIPIIASYFYSKNKEK